MTQQSTRAAEGRRAPKFIPRSKTKAPGCSGSLKPGRPVANPLAGPSTPTASAGCSCHVKALAERLGISLRIG